MKSFSFVVLCLLQLCGCALVTYREQIALLKGLARNEQEVAQYVERQTRGYAVLKEDIRSRRLEAGAAKEKIIAQYGEPVFCKDPGQAAGEACLYRRPTEYFTRDQVYLYFDAGGRLHSWEEGS